jgi:PncC family amidohydrolase
MNQPREVGKIARAKGLKLAVAESITGGLICSLLTDVPGSSDYFMAGFVTYSNASKVKILGVKEETLAHYGAVSEATAREMAAGARVVGGADIGVATTGIAGPTGATPTKPVGLVYMAVDNGRKVVVDSKLFGGDRIGIREKAAIRTLAMIIELLEES